MDHKGDVVVYHVEKDKSSCSSCLLPLNFEPVEVTRKLLQSEDWSRFTLVSPRLFKPWHGEYLAQICGYRIYNRTIVMFLLTQRYLEPLELRIKEIFLATHKVYLRKRN